MSVADVSSKLGEYMLKGWVLTDETCSNENCPVPLMRSPRGYSPVTTFCVNCDGDPQDRRTSVSNGVKLPSEQRRPSPSTATSSDTRLSRSSTPPTDISSDLSSPTFALPVETAESVRRRQQTDAASAEIGARLLKGWAMLADECPNEHCYGIPLVRPPLAGGRDPRRECVICHTVYVDEKDVDGWERLVVAGQRVSSGSTAVADPSSAPTKTPMAVSVQQNEKDKVSFNPGPHGVVASASIHSMNDAPPSSQVNFLENTGTSLELALQTLSQRLRSLTSLPAVTDPSAIGSTAEAMSKVLEALDRVRKLHGNSGS